VKDEPGRWVSSEEFWIERTEVTNRRYLLCMEAGACSPPFEETGAVADPRRADEPVTGVTWRQARSFVRWAGRRLPSEVEWERAARGEDATGRFPWGKGKLRDLANLEGTTEEDVFDGVAAVASFPTTGYGIYDLAGNVWEWCADTYHRDLSEGPPDGDAWTHEGIGRVLRGGSWRRTLEVARVSSRDWQEEDYFADDVGFRGVADVPNEVAVRRLVSLAQQSYPTRITPGLELERAELTPADRRYLEQTALNWLVLEGRIVEAVPRAVGMLKRNPKDPVAQDLLRHLEEEMASDLRRGEVRTVHAALNDYRSAVAGDRRLARRLADYEQRLMEEVRVNIEWFINRNDSATVVATVSLAEMLAPNDPVLVTLVASVEPRPGSIRVSARDGKEMVRIPGGEFLMGASPDDRQAGYDEHPAHHVKVRGFWLDRTEVTNDEYRRCVDAGVCSPPRRPGPFNDPNQGNLPVLWVDWFQARAYARWAGKRLPSEAEWEWAARAGGSSRFPWGFEWQEGRVNGMGAVSNDRWAGPSPVASFQPNEFGVYDLLGNAAEWVHDLYHQNYWDAPKLAMSWTQFNGGPVERRRVVRGGSYIVPWNRLRVSHREQRAPQTPHRGTGFRCASN
jgi:formylglycine-generating enzyme required for sulfatase activity